MIRPPLLCTRFPYTTLFRSVFGFYLCISGGTHSRKVLKHEPEVLAVGVTAEPLFPKRRLYPRDRKSTRLNSSHVEISYAVFCLKKKKNTHRDPISRYHVITP